MTWLRWWFVSVPEWGWQHGRPDHHGVGGPVALVLMAIAYVAVTLFVIGCVVRVVAFAGKSAARGFRRGWSRD
ncbi:hypothetical protein AB0N14_13485 [Streptomyces sp. NPDC051104]|uniref:hypothetical protein n=1 Tax=Streptomyces sp. NPDC051104 TaxID=3155044 RepID=UPI00343F7476